MISIRNLVKSFGAANAVDDISFAVPEGAFLVLVGPSGCGKSTMLRMLAGLEQPSGGKVQFGDKVVSDGAKGWTIDPAQRDTGLVFQSYALWPHMTVAGNVDWPLKVAGLSKPDRQARVSEVLKMLGIEALGARYPNEISGGQQQRVAIARMIAPRPSILLFDEPLSNLDAKLRVEMRTELLRVHRATGATSVYVTHDQVEAMTMATHVAVLNHGKVEQFGTPEALVQNPATGFVATFVGTPPANLVPVSALPPTLAFDLPPGASAMYRPEDLSVTGIPVENSLAFDFAEASPVAGRTMLTGTQGALRITAVVDAAPRFTVGDKAHFVLPQRPAALFGANGERLS
ncbi:ABC transporter ATP-binding protein [Devosia aurantiaca]|uniref:ABC transporter ATP-binding protein n=1 Tax=Devosia aurantiaca TaxID=2714858 RepID=A0A6M1SP87_9HYPH|nr:ABC transporter ATP-binding protein [Devosia aurantiaca]NGP17015.1 ABC transporter ATP-binding protein [Devosia aurantiaca]